MINEESSDFIKDVETSRYSDNTIKQYGYVISHLDDIVKQIIAPEIKLTDMGKCEFMRLKSYLLDVRNVSTATYLQYTSILEGYLKYNTSSNYLDLMSMRKPRRIRRRQANYLEVDDINMLRNALINSKRIDELLLLDVLYDTAARINEVRQIQWICIDDGYDAVRKIGVTNKVHGKGNKDFVLFYGSHTADTFNLYKQTHCLDNSDHIWVTKASGKPIDTPALRQRFNKLQTLLSNIKGCTVYFTPHDIRRSALRHYYLGEHYMCNDMHCSAGDIECVRMIAHHNSTDTTLKYIGISDDMLLAMRLGILL